MLINTDGIVLKSIKYEEADSIVILFTRKLGKISALAKGSRRAKSTLLSGTQVFSYSNFLLNKSSDMYKISQCEVKENFYNLSYDIDLLSYASYITQLVESSIFENQTNNRLFDLLLKTLYLYSKYDLDYIYITRIFELKFLHYIGYKPNVLKCVNCGNNNLNKGKFSIVNGGILCKSCTHIDNTSVKIDSSTIKLMEYILKNDIIICSKAKVSKYIINQLENILSRYLKVHVEDLNLKSLNFLENLKG
ncbi:DNA repair protein RecO [Tepidibacter formicigenes]|jgi:DNA repair protein RecO (recombination protein O)|uniref:DNA repair protein RecO n=1 Tax=Tepidibacter formicigenes DSM 15518 TaxID=1123349 RepID=A0A1M6TA45_9FIRM|nr:DNA repair protein RecO [Tepidibacter formicigenes]SHK53764.1 DNA replication and repair protein RecO [Tepidibacter formicigenes DSM 15518]